MGYTLVLSFVHVHAAYISLGYYELMDLSPHVLMKNDDVTSPVITVIFNVLLQVHVVKAINLLVLFCDTLFPITKHPQGLVCPEQKLKAQTFPLSNEFDTTDQDEQVVEDLNITYSFTIDDKGLCTAKFNILGSDGITHDTMFKNFSKFYNSDNSNKFIL